MVMIIKIGPGMKKVQRMLRNLPKTIQKEVGEKGTTEITKSLQRMMKLRAPRGTGWLRRSIMVEKTGKTKTVFVHAFYGMAVEKGRSRAFVIPLAYFEQHQKIPDAPGQFFTRQGQSPRRWVTLTGRAQPFVAPSLIKLKQIMPRILERVTARAIAEAAK